MSGRTSRRVVRTAWWSTVVELRSIAVCATLAAAIVVVVGWSVTTGDFALGLSQVIDGLVADDDSDAVFIVRTLRLPRALTGVFVGAALGMSGAIFQSVTRNPLGSPDIVGFTYGAAVGAVLVIATTDASMSAIATGAVAGGLVTATAVVGLSWRDGISSIRLVLIGIGLGFAALATVDYLITRADIHDVQQAAVWMTGSLNGRTWGHVRTAGLALAVTTPLVIAARRSLERLALGDDTAAALGIRVTRTKLLLVALAVVLASVAVASAGPIAFVALVAGPIARRLCHDAGACVVPAAFVGGLLTVAADLAARRVLAPNELPVGIATAVLGAPYLLWLLARRSGQGAL